MLQVIFNWQKTAYLYRQKNKQDKKGTCFYFGETKGTNKEEIDRSKINRRN